HLKNYPQAIAEAQTALKFNPQMTNALYTMALVYYDQKNYDQAVKILQQYAQSSSDPNSVSDAKELITQVTIYKNLFQAADCMEGQRFEQARKHLQQAAAYDPSPQSGKVHSSLAYVLCELHDPKAAVSEGMKALQYDPNDDHAVYAIGIAYGDLCKFEDAAKW